MTTTLLACLLAFTNPIVDMDMSDPDCTSADGTNFLSPRETEIVRYISQGKTHDEIGIILGISSETVRSHTKSIQRKLDCTNSASAVTRAFELGILRV